MLACFTLATLVLLDLLVDRAKVELAGVSYRVAILTCKAHSKSVAKLCFAKSFIILKFQAFSKIREEFCCFSLVLGYAQDEMHNSLAKIAW